MEALRIVAMSMILVWHFLSHGMTRSSFIDMGIEPIYPIISFFVFSGVNLFFMISGYFTIKYSSKKLIALVLNILAFGILNLLLGCVVLHDVHLTTIINTLFFPVSGSPYWFLSVYLLLMISAPLLNAGLNAIPLAQLRNVLLLLVLALAYMREHHASYNYMNGFLFYCIGYYFRHADVAGRFKKRWLLCIYILSCSLRIVANYVANRYLPTIMHDEFFDYENIFAVISATSLFLLFTKLKFQSKVINIIAGACLGCYMLQDGRFGFTYIYKWQEDFFYSHGFGIATLSMFALSFVCFWIASLILTEINKTWIGRLSDIISSRLRMAVLSVRNHMN